MGGWLVALIDPSNVPFEATTVDASKAFWQPLGRASGAARSPPAWPRLQSGGHARTLRALLVPCRAVRCGASRGGGCGMA